MAPVQAPVLVQVQAPVLVPVQARVLAPAQAQVLALVLAVRYCLLNQLILFQQFHCPQNLVL